MCGQARLRPSGMCRTRQLPLCIHVTCGHVIMFQAFSYNGVQPAGEMLKTEQMREALSFEEDVLFAGEHSSPLFPGTVDGEWHVTCMPCAL